MTSDRMRSSRTSLIRSMEMLVGGGFLGPIMAVRATTKAQVAVVVRGIAATSVILVGGR